MQWFREQKFLMDGRYASLDDWLRADWEGGYYPGWDANDMLALLSTWHTGDVSKVKPIDANGVEITNAFAPGDLTACLNGITAKGLIMPCKNDLYFPVRS